VVTITISDRYEDRARGIEDLAHQVAQAIPKASLNGRVLVVLRQHGASEPHHTEQRPRDQ